MRLFFTITTLCFLSVCSLKAQQWGYYTLVAPQSSKAYLVDTGGTIQVTYSFTTGNTGYSAYMLPGGTIVRSVSSGSSMAGGTGRVEKVTDINGTVSWYYTNSAMHHDICPLPNGNVLVIVQVAKTSSEVTAAGASYNGSVASEAILEIQPSGTSGGTVVWQWDLWDHLCQSYNSGKNNYVSNTADHPELLNINYLCNSSDFFHLNGLDYNEYRDQIVFSSHYWNQVFVIDHSTTTAEAKTHAGGKSGKGGDFLYRWGNPASYGASGTTNFNTVHDGHWVPQDVTTFGNYIGAFNNQGGTGNKSAADVINPPYDGDTLFDWGSNGVYTPSTYTWRYTASASCTNMGNDEQLPNGNTLICIANSMIQEVTPSGTALWTYSKYSAPQAHRYSKCYYSNTRPATPTISASGNVLTATTTSTGTYTYQWFYNAYMISGATSQTYTATASGIYQVQVRAAEDCYSAISAKYSHTYSSGTTLVTSVSLSPSTLTLYTGSTSTLTATVLPTTATNSAITWTSSNTSVATVSSSGVVTAVAAGTATITATAADGSGVTGTCAVTVKQYVTSITLSSSTLSLATGASSTLTATVLPTTATNTSVTWVSSNTNYVTVSSAGVVYAVAAGTATITVTASDGSGVYSTCVVTVTSPTYTQTISLNSGWNLISFYVVPTSNTVESVFGSSISKVTEVKTMDAFWSASNISAYNSLTTMSAGSGYFVYCTSAFTLSVSGTMTTLTFPTSFDSGWNLVGVPSASSLTISSTINSSDVSYIKNFDGFWKSGGSTNSLSTLDPGKAYFVKGN